MNESLQPLSAEEKRVLELAGQFEPPSGAEQRVFASLQASIGLVPTVSSASPTAHARGMMGGKAVALIAGAMLTVGVGAGVVLGRTAFAPEPQRPHVIERVVR